MPVREVPSNADILARIALEEYVEALWDVVAGLVNEPPLFTPAGAQRPSQAERRCQSCGEGMQCQLPLNGDEK